MGRFGWRSGSLKAQNVQAGTVSFADGEDTATVDFAYNMKEAPSVVVTPADDADVSVPVDTVTTDGFTVERADDTGDLTAHYVAVNDDRNE